MTEHNDNYHTLPGNCVVRPVTYSHQHITLTPRLLSPFGFTSDTPAMVLMTPGCLVITTQPEQQAVLRAITELQLRQDETKQDFTDAIQGLLARFVT